MIESFQFDDDGRTYTCRIEEPRGGRTEAWWWFGVSGDAHRYAPFQATADDTEAGVRSRVVTYYRDLLARRAMPAQPRSHWARRTPTASTGAPETLADAPETATLETPAGTPAQV
jgi:hypothetical protein